MEKSTFLIIGKHAVVEALKNSRRKVTKIYINEHVHKEINRSNQPKNIFQKTKVIFKTKKELDNLCGRDQINHQGIVGEVLELDNNSLKSDLEFLNKENINFLALENISDPRNLGSIIRSAASFNIDGIIVNERKFPNKSKLLYKAASGAMEHINIYRLSNIKVAFNLLKKKGFWISAFSSHAEKSFTTNNWKGKNILLFGSEGKGLKKNTKEKADFYYKINIKNIESLNVSNSVSIVCHFINEKIS